MSLKRLIVASIIMTSVLLPPDGLRAQIASINGNGLYTGLYRSQYRRSCIPRLACRNLSWLRDSHHGCSVCESRKWV